MTRTVVLRNKDVFLDLMRLQLSDGHRSPAEDIDPRDYDSFHGFFQIWGGTFLAVFSQEERVFFVHEQDILPIEEMRFVVTGPLDRREFTAWRDGQLVCRITDSVHNHGYIEGDPTAFTEMEDFDFGLYAQRVAAHVQK